MSKRLFAVMTVIALGALGVIAVNSRPAATVSSQNATKPVVETKVIHKTVRIKRRAKSTSGGTAVRSAAPVARPVAAPRVMAQSTPREFEHDDDSFEHEDSEEHEYGGDHQEDGEHESEGSEGFDD